METAAIKAIEQLETTITDFVLSDQHIYLLIGVVCIIALLKYITPLQDILFSEKRKWLVAPINVVLSLVGVFALKLTPATTIGLKIIVALVISTFATFAYEALLKRIMGFVQTWIDNRKNGKQEPPAPTTTA